MSDTKAIRISYDSGEYFVSAKSGANFKSDSVYHDINKAFSRAFALLEGDAKKVESQRLTARLRELEAQNAELIAALAGLADDISGLMEESHGVIGLHLNGDAAPWDELDAGGRFERLTHLPIARAVIEAVKGIRP